SAPVQPGPVSPGVAPAWGPPAETPPASDLASSGAGFELASGAALADFGQRERVLEPGVSWPLKAARAVLDLSERFDAFTYGHRLFTLYVLAGAYCVTALLSALFGQLVWEKIALALFFAALAV